MGHFTLARGKAHGWRTGIAGGPGCSGCHEGRGLRRHHDANGEDFCYQCHSNSPAPPEGTLPAYYTSALTNVRGPCNDVAAIKTNENWTIGDFVGLDNDGDNKYDTADPDCAVATGAGQVGKSLNMTMEPNGDLTLTWAGSCTAADDDDGIYEGMIGGVFDNHQFVVCTTAGALLATFTPNAGDTYYLVAASNPVVEGSYGQTSAMVERPQGVSTCANQMVANCP